MLRCARPTSGPAPRLVLAGLVADGVTEVAEIRHIDRGYVRFDEQLRQLGADDFARAGTGRSGQLILR